ncbi:iron-siderophore ABC transporter substrate-binding protein [Jiella sp. MQZ9-1]|uniref:Iron-siderophore ABC transporter substrate-binding protein n=1 Tax=Jiella flava TaxID=2816857 RepID=A0A939FY36_9HYPH|nr:iron-siderophore ABC transporter substrate-binding protein [Jiella flava]MBO0662305.1 iron-siderophore ABC transporter substrate-binding protein [Jiella flava]MCD2470864.1 iron-siderophore ABC transporter substrate-binding protein [Jiella flava]
MARAVVTCIAAGLAAVAAWAMSTTASAEETHSSQPPKRVVAMEWAQLETLLALGITPVGAADARGYREWVSSPRLPESVADIGSRQQPNLEELAQLKPDRIFSQAHLRPLKARLAAIAPVSEITFNGTGGDTFAAVVAGTRAIGEVTDKQAEADALIAKTDAALAMDAKRLQAAGFSGRSVYVVRIIGPHAIRVHGQNSIADTVLAKLGLKNAYRGKVNEWGFATVEPSALADDPKATIVVAGPVTKAEMAAVFETPLGKALPAVRAGAVYRLPVVWTFGGLPSAITMADAIAAALTKSGN